MQLHWLSYLLAVNEAGSISKAARRLYLNQQHLSKIIAGIEKELDTQIFIRNARGIKATEAGEKVLAWAKSVVESFETLNAEIHPAQAEPATIPETLHIQCISSNVNEKYIKILDQFSAQYPQISLIFDENSSEEVIANVENDTVDIGIVLLFPEYENITEIIPKDIDYTSCYSGKMAIFVPPEHHLAATHKQISMKELQDETFIIYSPNSSEYSLGLKMMKFFSEYTYKTKYSISNITTYFRLLRTGNYVHLGATSNFAQLNKKGLVMIPISDSIICETGIIVKQSRRELPFIKIFIELYLQSFKD